VRSLTPSRRTRVDSSRPPPVAPQHRTYASARGRASGSFEVLHTLVCVPGARHAARRGGRPPCLPRRPSWRSGHGTRTTYVRGFRPASSAVASTQVVVSEVDEVPL